MKNQYEEKILEFYSEEENFKTMVSVVDAFPAVANHIIKGFWDQVKERLRNLLPEEDWIIGYSNAIFGQHVNKLWIFHKSWKQKNGNPVIAAAFEGLQLDREPWVGVFLDQKTEGYNISAISKAIKMLPELENYEEDNNQWWPKWEYVSPSITQRREIVKLVSSNKSEIIEAVALQALTALEIIKSKAKEILIQNKI